MIFVESEFAPLRTVVLAQSEMAAPEKPKDSDLQFLTAEFRDWAKGMAGRDHAIAFPERQRLWEKERDDFQAVLEKHGVEVLRPRQLTIAEKAAAGANGYANFFARDPFFVVGPFVIEGSMRFLHRREEVLPTREIMRERVYPADCIYVAAPRPEIAAADDSTLGPGPFIEGGDVLVLGKHVFVGNSGLASNALGIRWLAKLLQPHGYSVEPVRLAPDILHLDCAIGLISEGLLTVCETALLDGLPERLQGWNRISVRHEDASLLATNGLPLSPSVYVTDPAFRSIGDRVGDHGIDVEYVDFSITRGFGGAFRCSTQPLLRID